MRILHGLESRASGPTVLTIGNFDGVHRGHEALLAVLVARARALGLPSTVMCFEPHPREFFAPQQAPARLSSLRDKLERLAGLGVDQVYVCRFNAALAAMEAQNFIDALLVRRLAVRHVVIGDDFRFGCKRRGDFALLEAAGLSAGFSVEAMHTVEIDGLRASSSALRAALECGDLDLARRLQGRRFQLSGRVRHGNKLGRELGYPTANLQLHGRRLPLAGIFAVSVEGDGLAAQPGAASLGVRPTLGEGLQPSCEVFLLDFEGDLYRRHLRITFHKHLREERRFDTLDALKAAIAADVAATRAYFDNFHPDQTAV
ncbi:MAG: bifunctional riboflavin kinase/FAD synthetase [Rhodocyclaceae bacterium]|nr:bifunctional riboflavin kinase/FAD synthetase [Rhodocyclaceae bacterium]